MTTYLLRDGTTREIDLHPDGLDCLPFQDENNQTIYAVLSTTNELSLKFKTAKIHLKQSGKPRHRRDQTG
ncbi:MAG: hypothetical protein CL862_07170 [Cyanobium sp. NAT70]|nr:hypothetical protein [Cyanobium sp. NAT70]|tara:strand:+ start:2247 stop:2456 length:210 start_codon:yes stop_codon:yes gene_type:complete